MAGSAKGPLARPYIIQERGFGQEAQLYGGVLGLEKCKIDSSRELHRERKALRADSYCRILSELKLRPPEKLRRQMFASQIRSPQLADMGSRKEPAGRRRYEDRRRR
jgi:hypothetical protein